jgi:glycogenin glucosyltransferase
MYYEVPKTPTYQKPTPIFPWEKNDAPKPTRVFAEDEVLQPASEKLTKDEQATPVASTVTTTHSDPWHSFSSNSRNAWDDIPEIEQYIGALQRNRRGNLQILQGFGAGVVEELGAARRRTSVRVTDFPSEIERPSLPVTPAPIRRPKFAGDNSSEGDLPVAEGVPAQTEWVCMQIWLCLARLLILILVQDPAAQLDALARRQSEVLGKSLGEGAKEIPQRPLPYGSEGAVITSPIASPKEAKGTKADLQRQPSKPVKGSFTAFQEPSYGGPGAAWEKDENPVLHETPLGPTEEEQDALSGTTEVEMKAGEPLTKTLKSVEEPSYSGPGAAWDKDGAPATKETPLGPSEEEQDALAE